MAIAGGAVASWKWMRQAPQPLARQAINVLGRQSIGEAWHKHRIRTGLDTVVERLECRSPLGKLSFEIFVTVDAELGSLAKVGTKLQEQRAEVLVNATKMVVIDHRGGFDDLGIGGTCAAVFCVTLSLR